MNYMTTSTLTIFLESVSQLHPAASPLTSAPWQTMTRTSLAESRALIISLGETARNGRERQQGGLVDLRCLK
jgi:hypothetical protein